MYIVSVILLNVLIVVHRFIAEITIDHKQVSLSTISSCHEKKMISGHKQVIVSVGF